MRATVAEPLTVRLIEPANAAGRLVLHGHRLGQRPGQIRNLADRAGNAVDRADDIAGLALDTRNLRRDLLGRCSRLPRERLHFRRDDGEAAPPPHRRGPPRWSR